MADKPKMPTGTQAAGKRLWSSVIDEYDLDQLFQGVRRRGCCCERGRVSRVGVANPTRTWRPSWTPIWTPLLLHSM